MRSINTMMMAAIAAIIALVLASAGVSLWANGQQSAARARVSAASRLLRNHMTADMMHDAVRGDVLSILRAIRVGDLSLTDNRKALEQDVATLRKALAADRAYTAAPEVVAAATQIQPQVDAYIASARAVAATAAVDQDRASTMLPAFLRTFHDLESGMETVSNRLEAHLTAVDADADRIASFASLSMIATALALLALVGTIGVLCRRYVVAPLLQLVSVLNRMTSGDLAVAVPATGRGDELGQLAGATTALRDQLVAAEQAKAAQTTLIVDSFGQALSRLAEGDLVSRVDADLTGPFARIKDDFNAAVSALQTTLAAMSESASSINSGAGDIRQASDDLSQRTEQQAASLEETAAAMDEITSTVRSTAERAGSANAAVRSARDEAQHSGAVVRNAVEAMGGIERTSGEISEIISVIDGIAFQTNLLALNAGVEAARAGDAGKGFAVVASEVRALAQRSAEAAKDVKTRITASSQQVDEGVRLVGETGQALQRIIDRIAEIDGLVADIARSAEQQATGLQQVNTAVSEMDGVTQQNAAMVEEATAAARSLAAEAEAMARQITRFRTGSGSASMASPVAQLQERAAVAGRQIAAAGKRRATGNLAVVESSDDWSEF
ncbi:methyl-accepting chemotaxis protein [Arthrobacter sp. TPD3018]|nr:MULTISPECIES: methyl-accepting chemotaxis protein [Bacteria]PVE60196.1 methyl-accepting chemotaxis protein [Sphingomonas sp. TPD3009]PVE61710.1 methyl-accepting chemotaxis protein [Arthrobacter sp. TPD3018]PVE85373.1 methyl-accepting chemotaxis protein [Sphingomonas melonis]